MSLEQDKIPNESFMWNCFNSEKLIFRTYLYYSRQPVSCLAYKKRRSQKYLTIED